MRRPPAHGLRLRSDLGGDQAEVGASEGSALSAAWLEFTGVRNGMHGRGHGQRRRLGPVGGRRAQPQNAERARERGHGLMATQWAVAVSWLGGGVASTTTKITVVR